MHYLMAITSMKLTWMKLTHREVDEINFSIHVRKTGKWQIKCFECITCHKILYLFGTVAPHCNWLSYQRDQLRISQSTNTWIKEFLLAANCRWNATHIQLCVWCSLFPTSLASFNETIDSTPCPLWLTIDRSSGPTCSLFPSWSPSMKPLIVSSVLFNETIDSLR